MGCSQEEAKIYLFLLVLVLEPHPELLRAQSWLSQERALTVLTRSYAVIGIKSGSAARKTSAFLPVYFPGPGSMLRTAGL